MAIDRWLIVGLGNPGSKYLETRHNIGFLVVDAILEELGGYSPTWREESNHQRSEVSLAGSKLTLMKPLTYMNLSGDAVQPVAQYYKLPPEQVVVIHDEIDLPYGKLRLQKGGGSGGHNGIKSVAARLGTQNFFRIRVGVGRPKPRGENGEGPVPDVSDWVLSRFDKAEWDQMRQVLTRTVGAVKMICQEGLKAAQTRYN